MNNKVILIDFGIFMFRAIYAFRKNRSIPATYTAVNMIISNLKKIGVDPDDEIIIAVDARNNWRKTIDPEYKGNRKDLRESQSDINWDKMWEDFGNLVENLKETSPFQIIKIDTLEADDIIAYSCRYFKDQECIIVSYDADYEMLCVFPNVKIFSPIKKLGAKKGAYKIIKDGWKVLAKKIKKEASDNLVSPILTERDFDKRRMIVDLTTLPDFVEVLIKEALGNLQEKDYDLERFPFENLKNRFMSIYNNDEKNIITYEKCVAYAEKKKLKKKKKPIKKEK